MRSSTTLLALIGVALATVTGTAVAANPATPVVCGSNGCAPLPTSTLQGLLTLPEALEPAEPPPSQPFVLFRVAGFDGVMHEVVYVRRDDEALLGFEGSQGWRIVPADDARLLADAVRGTTPYPAPAAGTNFGRRFTGDDNGGWGAGRVALAALVGIAVLGLVAYVWVSETSRRTR